MICVLWKYGPIYVIFDVIAWYAVGGAWRDDSSSWALFLESSRQCPMYPCGCTWPLAANSILWCLYNLWWQPPCQEPILCHLRCIETNGFALSISFIQSMCLCTFPIDCVYISHRLCLCTFPIDSMGLEHLLLPFVYTVCAVSPQRDTVGPPDLTLFGKSWSGIFEPDPACNGLVQPCKYPLSLVYNPTGQGWAGLRSAGLY